MYWPLINPEFNSLITFLGEIQYQISWHRLYYFIAITLMLGNIIVLVFVIWMPFGICLSENVSMFSTNYLLSIYKTINMLPIISMEILASLKSINGLLGLNQDIH